MMARQRAVSDTIFDRRKWYLIPLLTLISLLIVVLTGCASSKSHMVVSVPLVDLRAQPHTTATPNLHDPLQETQLLYGERVRVRKTRDGWAQVEALEQSEFSHHRKWQGYPGWVPQSALVSEQAAWPPTIVVTTPWAVPTHDAHLMRPSRWRFPMGTYLRATDMAGQLWKVELLDGSVVWLSYTNAKSLEDVDGLPPAEKRESIVASAQRLVGTRYFWGGRSSAANAPQGTVAGVDCSGLVNLAYRTVGMTIPRDAHEQHLRAHQVERLEPADLIFLSDHHDPKRIVHVMLYAGEGEVIEGPGTGLAVRRISLKERLGQSVDELAAGDLVGDQTISFGTYF